MRLFYFPPHKAGEQQVVYTHPIGNRQGRLGDPRGHDQDRASAEGPVWHPPISVIKEHKENGDVLPSVVGPRSRQPARQPRFLSDLGGLSHPRHHKPAGVGLRSSHGCIRLFPEDIDELFEKVPIGTQVHVVNQPYVFGWDNGQLVMQSFGSLEG